MGTSPASFGAPASSQLQQRLVVLAVRLEPLAAGVRHGADRLLQQQALRGHGQVDAADADLAREAVVVAVGIEAEQRKPEAVLAAGRAVAAAGVAARRMKTGITSSWKLIGRSAAASFTVDRAGGLEPWYSTSSVVWPSATGIERSGCRAAPAAASASLTLAASGHVERHAVVARGDHRYAGSPASCSG